MSSEEIGGARSPLDDERARAVLGEFFNRLEPDPRVERRINLDRGIAAARHREVVRCVTPSAVHRAYERVEERFSPDDLYRAGIVIRDARGQLIRNPQFLRAEVFFAARDCDGRIVVARPHKKWPKGLGHFPFNLGSVKQGAPVSVVEGEFKALALTELGMPAVSVPGITTFNGKNFGILAASLRALGVKRVTVVFDNADQVNEVLDGGRSNPKYKNSEDKRWHVEQAAVVLGRRLTYEVGIDVRYLRLPDAARIDGEADIDGALVAKTLTPTQLKALPSLSEREYLDAVGADAARVIQRRLRDGELIQDHLGHTRLTLPGLRLEFRREHRRGNRAERMQMVARRGAAPAAEYSAKWDDVDDCRKAAKRLQKEVGVSPDVVNVVEVSAQYRELQRAADERQAQEARELASGECRVRVGSQEYIVGEKKIWVEHQEDIATRQEVCSARLRLLQDVQIAAARERSFYVVSVEVARDDDDVFSATWEMPYGAIQSDAQVRESVHEHVGAHVVLDPHHARNVIFALQHVDAPERVVSAGQIGWDRDGAFQMPSVTIAPTAEIVPREGPFYVEGVTGDIREARDAETAPNWMQIDFEMPPPSKHKQDELVRRWFMALAACFDWRSACFKAAAAALSIASGMVGGASPDIRTGVRASLWVVGKSGIGKSSLMRYMACLFGRFWRPGAIPDGSASLAVLTEMGARFRHVPFPIDDVNRSKMRDFETAAAELIQRHGDGAGRQRANRDGTQRPEQRCQGLLVINGEEPPPGGEAPQARVLVVHHHGQLGDARDFEELQERSYDGPQIGALLASFIASTCESDNLRRELAESKIRWLNELGPGENHARIAEGLAQYRLGMRIWVDFLIHHTVVPADHREMVLAHVDQLISDVLPDQRARVTDKAVGIEFLEKLFELQASRQNAIETDASYGCGNATDACAVWDTATNELLVLPSRTLTRLNKELGWEPSLGRAAIGQDLKTRGLLRPPPNTGKDVRLEARRQLAGKAVRVWVLDGTQIEQLRHAADVLAAPIPAPTSPAPIPQDGSVVN